MNIRAIALAVPLALGTACQHAQTRGTTEGTATAPPATQEPQATGPATGGGPLAEDPIMRPGPSVQGHGEDQVVAGHITEVSEDEVAIETNDGQSRTLQIVPETTIELDGEEASSDDLAEGQPVRASFDVVDGQDVAVKIHAGDAAAGTAASEPPEELGAPGADRPGATDDASSDQGGMPGAAGSQAR